MKILKSCVKSRFFAFLIFLSWWYLTSVAYRPDMGEFSPKILDSPNILQKLRSQGNFSQGPPRTAIYRPLHAEKSTPMQRCVWLSVAEVNSFWKCVKIILFPPTVWLRPLCFHKTHAAWLPNTSLRAVRH